MLLNNEVDVFVSYKNTGKVHPDTGKFLVQPEYTVKERTWRTFWNADVNLLSLVKNSVRGSLPGREQRVREGLYTDGEKVYVSGYDYSTGRNGMKTVGELGSWLESGKISGKDGKRLMARVKKGVPDVVREPFGGEEE